MTWREAHEEAMFAAAEAHEELEIDPSLRIDVFESVRRCGLDLIFRPMRGLSGLYVPPPVAGAPPGVLVSSHHREARQRFTAAHELGHFWFKHQGSIDPDAEPHLPQKSDRIEPKEMLADAFAAWFLMPPELVDAVMEELGFDTLNSPTEVYRLSLRLGTSYPATLLHLPNLKLLSVANANRWATQSVKPIKVALCGGVPMSTYHPDVHLLSSSPLDKTIHVQAGDRLVVTEPGATHCSLGNLTISADFCTSAQTGKRQDPVAFPDSSTGLVLDLAANIEGPLTIAFATLSSESHAGRIHLMIHAPLSGRYRPWEEAATEEHTAIVTPIDRLSRDRC